MPRMPLMAEMVRRILAPTEQEVYEELAYKTLHQVAEWNEKAEKNYGACNCGSTAVLAMTCELCKTRLLLCKKCIQQWIDHVNDCKFKKGQDDARVRSREP